MTMSPWDGLFTLDGVVRKTRPERQPPTDATRVLELQKAHKALLRKNRQIETLKERVRALENTVRMVNEDYAAACRDLQSSVGEIC